MIGVSVLETGQGCRIEIARHMREQHHVLLGTGAFDRGLRSDLKIVPDRVSDLGRCAHAVDTQNGKRSPVAVAYFDPDQAARWNPFTASTLTTLTRQGAKTRCLNP